LNRLKIILTSRYVLWLALGAPFAWLVGAWFTGILFYGELLHASGEFSARLLILTMSITSLRLMFPDASWAGWLVRQRRYFGVATFAYAVLHTLVYIDRKQDFALMLEEGLDFSMWTGWVALAVFLALALTSNNSSVRRLKRAWKQLHRWVYPAALLTFVHWIFIAFDFVPGLLHFLVLLFFETYRVWKTKKLAVSA